MRRREFITIIGRGSGSLLSKTWLRLKSYVSAKNGQISVRAILTRTHFFDAIETVLQRSNGDH